ncbi:hypothetical protein ACVLD2_001992 [Paenibacillus sp. PvR052]
MNDRVSSLSGSSVFTSISRDSDFTAAGSLVAVAVEPVFNYRA